MALSARWLDFIGRIGRNPSATDEEHLPVFLMVSMGLLMSAGGLMWAGAAVVAGFATYALFPFGYGVVTAVNLWVLDRTRQFGRARLVQLTISLVAPFLCQWGLGGFAASGATMLWATLSLVGALAVSRARDTVPVMLGFVALSLVSGIVEPYLRADPRMTAEFSTALFVLNGIGVTGTLFGLTTYLDNRRRRDYQALRRANDMIGQLNERLTMQIGRAAEAERDARQANQAKSNFLANMSHELRTPLNAILGYAEMIAEDSSDETARTDATQIRQAGAHLLSLIDDVLDIAKIESGRMEVRVEEVLVAELVEGVVTTLRPLAVGRGNSLEVAVDPELRAWTDPRMFRQILINVMGNAVKFTEDGSLSVSVTHQAGRLSLVVQDTGIGMTAEQLGRVLEPFQQADASTTRRYGGSGLGLFLVRRFAEMLEGEVTLASSPGCGTTVTVTVPTEHPSG